MFAVRLTNMQDLGHEGAENEDKEAYDKSVLNNDG